MRKFFSKRLAPWWTRKEFGDGEAVGSLDADRGKRRAVDKDGRDRVAEIDLAKIDVRAIHIDAAAHAFQPVFEKSPRREGCLVIAHDNAD